MKVAAITLMKNEADVLPFKLKYMENMVDYFLFLDNDSDDGSAEIVKRHSKTVFCGSTKETYRTTLRDILLEEVQKYIDENDWIVYSDPDEFPFFNIKEVCDKITNNYNCAVVHRPFFFFTREMYEKWETDTQYRIKIQSFHIENYQYFAPTEHHEIRMIKNEKIDGERVKLTKLKMPLPLPEFPIIYDNELYFGHYQYRNPEQMIKRLETRRKAIEKGSPSFHFYTEKWGLRNWDYKKLFVPQNKLLKYDYQTAFSLKGVKLKKMNKLFYKFFNPKMIILSHLKYIFKK